MWHMAYEMHCIRERVTWARCMRGVGAAESGARDDEDKRMQVEVSGGKDQGMIGELKMASELVGCEVGWRDRQGSDPGPCCPHNDRKQRNTTEESK